ncbi:MAG: thermostable hemolysin delta-VPH [Clostridia bacterium]|nr:thermostable hemolysin delta-VPH [Clostridia bacterium]
MEYFSYHAIVKRMIAEGKLTGYYFTDEYHGISPALVLLFNDTRRPVMVIREHRWETYAEALKHVPEAEKK